MRNEPNLRIEHLRRTHPTIGASPGGASWGYFVDGPLRIISSGARDTKYDIGEHRGIFGEWEHVSVSREDRIPSWNEMSHVKELFWRDDECVIQFHPPKDEYVNHHPHVLHLWKPPYDTPRPPRETMAP